MIFSTLLLVRRASVYFLMLTTLLLAGFGLVLGFAGLFGLV